MENIAYAQQIIDINRVAATNMQNVVTLVQKQAERTVQSLIEQGTEIVEEGQRIMEEWTKEYKRSQQAVQSVVEENRVNLEQLFSPPAQPKAPTKTRKAK